VISLYNGLSHTRIAGGFLFRFRSFFRPKNALAQLAKAINKKTVRRTNGMLPNGAEDEI
jgi:hypothetical protein